MIAQAIPIASGQARPGASPTCWAYLPLPVAKSGRYPIPLSRVRAPPVLTPFQFHALGESVASLGKQPRAAIVHLQVAWPATFSVHHPFSHLLGPLALPGLVIRAGSRNSSVWDSVFSESRTGLLNRLCRIVDLVFENKFRGAGCGFFPFRLGLMRDHLRQRPHGLNRCQKGPVFPGWRAVPSGV